VFTTIDALTFLNFDDDSLTNRNLFIKLRDNVFFMFFEFMISTFVHEFLSREFVMLLFFAIRINVENNSKNVFDFKFATIFFFWNDHFSFMKKRFRFYELCDNELENFANRLRFFCEIKSHFDATRQIDLCFLFLLCNSKFTRCVHDFHMRRISWTCQWCWDLNRSCDVFSHMCRIWQQFCNVYRYNRIFDN
jgi:hypothetical protein